MTTASNVGALSRHGAHDAYSVDQRGGGSFVNTRYTSRWSVFASPFSSITTIVSDSSTATGSARFSVGDSRDADDDDDGDGDGDDGDGDGDGDGDDGDDGEEACGTVGLDGDVVAQEAAAKAMSKGEVRRNIARTLPQMSGRVIGGGVASGARAHDATWMRTARFGAAGVDVAVVGQGTWNCERDRAGALRALRRGLELGMTHVDTAEMYGDGEAEQIVGEAIRGRRGDVFLVSKVLPRNASKAGTVRACEQSLRRLDVDALDVLLLHWRGQHPLAETIAAFESLKADGKIKAWGVSNFDVDDMIEVLGIAGPAKCACNQALLHLEERYAEGKLRDVCRENDVALVAYSPLGSGSFPRGKKRKLLDEIAATHGVDAHAVALAFLSRDDVFVIPKATDVAHVEVNATAGDVRLSDDEIRRIDTAFPIKGTELGVI